MGKLQKSWFIALVALALLAAACGDDEPSGGTASATTTARTPVSVTIAEATHAVDYLPVYLADELGYFEDAGLDVEIKLIRGSGGPAHVNAVISKDAYAFIGGAEHVVLSQARGAELVSVLGLVENSLGALVAKPDSGLRGDAASLRGKRIGVSSTGQTPNFGTRKVLADLGLDPAKDVTLVELDGAARLAALAKGDIDFAVVGQPNLEQGQLQGIFGEPLEPFSEEVSRYFRTVLGVRVEAVEDDPTTVDALVGAIRKAVEAVYDDPEKARELLPKLFAENPADVIEAAFEKAVADKRWNAEGEMSTDTFDTVVGFAAETGVDVGDVRFDSVFDDQFLES